MGTQKDDPDFYDCLIDLEINPNHRLADRIRSSLLQLDVSKTSSGERLRDLLQEYSQEVDRHDTVNSYINLSLNIFNNKCIRPCGTSNWKSMLKEKLDNGMKLENLLSANNPKLAEMMKISSEFRKLNRKRLIRIKLPNPQPQMMVEKSTDSQKYISSQDSLNGNSQGIKKETSSPTRVPGISKKNKPNSFTRSLFCKTESMEQTDNLTMQPVNLEIEEIKQPSKSFMTGLEKRLVDEVINNNLDQNEARKIIKEVRDNNSSSLFKDPMKRNGNENNDDNNVNLDSVLANDERLKGIDPSIIRLIEGEIIDNLDDTDWNNIAGLEGAKAKIQQVAIMPLTRPDLFTGIRSPPKGILLFGPPGTGKTMIGRCIASQAKATFFSITSSTLTSKWIGDGEKAIKAMFQVARIRKPSVIFIDEIDSILKTRSDDEHESSRRMKTEFLSQFDGLSNQSNNGLLFIGTTNRPQELDEAVRRRFAVKLFIPLPEKSARKQMVVNILKNEKHCLSEEQIDSVAAQTEGYSGSDMKNLCTEAATYSIFENAEQLIHITKEEIRAIRLEDFQRALTRCKPSLSQNDLADYETWNKKFGS